MRTVIVGDVHGCSAELETLLDRIAFAEGDRLVMVGDLVARGPDSRGALALVRTAKGRSALGNHEAKLLAWREHGAPLRPGHQHVADSLSDEDWQMLEAMPLAIDLPEHAVRVVHAGVLPGTPVDRMAREALLTMRTIDDRGEWSASRDGGALWGSLYEGPPHVVFGHNARDEMQLWPHATGLDTACVYGNRLTALVLAEGELVPQGESARHRTTSVPAMRQYCAPR
ncbi:MAG: metallophosphoesterase family protein [Polyangiaceae bacterium]